MHDVAKYFQPSPTLKSRSFGGLVASQFLAAFNDQASHIVAIFYATDMLVRFVGISRFDTIVTVVTACFIAPFFLFSPIAGMLADHYSKRTIVVFWKMAEIGIMTLAVVAFLLPHLASGGWGSPGFMAKASSVLVIAVVFMMGTHSAFFIPAKYGMMPEILDTSVLSRGNGLLEGTSFLANILGTMFGALIYLQVKSNVDNANVLHPGNEWLIGVVLLMLSGIGAAASLLIERIPAAAADKPLILDPYTAMKQNLGVLRRSRSLILATIGIAFFLFMTLFMRQTLILQGETGEERELVSQLPKPAAPVALAPEGPQEPVAGEEIDIAAGLASAVQPEGAPTEKTKGGKTELQVAIWLGIVSIGVGVGCALAGYFSGNRLELGLVPIGLVLMIFATAAMTMVIQAKGRLMIACLAGVGSAAGLYIVPLYTLLQHRAPKESKGSLVATSNFFNVTGGLIAVLLFWAVSRQLRTVLGLTLNLKSVKEKPELIAGYLHQLDRAAQIPQILFLLASVITLAMFVLVWWQRPDFILRALSWIRSRRRRHLRALGLDNVPANGQVILISNSHDFDHWIHVVSTVDRFTRFVAPPDATGDRMLRGVALSSGVMIAANRKVRLSAEDNALARGLVTLGQGYMLGLSLARDFAADTEPGRGEHLLCELRIKVRPTILPVYCGEKPTHPEALRMPQLHTYVVIGEPLPPDTPLEEVRAAVCALGA